jgi:PEGA domain
MSVPNVEPIDELEDRTFQSQPQDRIGQLGGEMSRSICWAPCALLLAGLPTRAADADRVAVVAVGTCDAASGIAARSFRTALAQKLGAAVQSEAETARPFGGFSDKTVSAINTAVTSARSDFYSDHPAEALKTLRGALDDVARIAPSDARWVAERDALTLLSQVQQKTDKAAAEAALQRIFRVDPDYRPDTSLYPPSFRRFADTVRKAAKKRPTVRFEITTAPPGKPVYVGGRRVGVGPMALRVPAGEYRVEADWGHRGVVRSVTVPSSPVELSAAVDGAVHPEDGPCVEATDPPTALARVAKATGTSRAYGVHTDSADSNTFVVVTSSDASGSDVREGRVKLEQGAPSTEALGLLSGFAAGGSAVGAVEVTRGPGAGPPVTPTVASAAAAASGATTAGTPAAATPASSGERGPNDTRFEASVRVGFGLPLGSLSEGAGSLSDYSSFTIPVMADVGVRLLGHVFLGAYFQYGFAGSTDAGTCGAGFSCSPSTLRFGGEVHWHPLGNVSIDPWVGLGSGYERVSIGVTGASSGTFDVSGWEFVNLQAGLDFAIGSVVKIGPWISFSLGQYGSVSASGGGQFGGADITNKALHEWLSGGVRLVILP